MSKTSPEAAFYQKLNSPHKDTYILNIAHRFLKDNDRYEARPLGNDEANITSINASGNSGAALVERVTNSEDSYLELQVFLNPKYAEAKTQKELINGHMGYNIPYMNEPKRKALAKEVGRIDRHVILEDGKVAKLTNKISKREKTQQCITIQDNGIGMTNSEFVNTGVLSIRKSNKKNKPWLQGQFGHGGSATFAFCGASFLASRKYGSDEINFSVVFKQPPTGNQKLSTYMMIVDKKTGLPISVHTKDVVTKPITHGTKITHFNYASDTVGGLFSNNKKSINLLYRKALPNVELPFYYVDHNPSAGKRDDHVLQGAGKVLERWKVGHDAGGANSWKVEYMSLEGDKDGFEEVPFVFDDEAYTIRLRAYLLAHTAVPANFFDRSCITINGQAHHYLDGRSPIFTKFPTTKEHLFVDGDIGTLPAEKKSDLTLSNRGGVQEGVFFNAIVETIRLWLLDQQDLVALEQKWKTDSFTNTTSNKKSSDIAEALGIFSINPKHLGGNRTQIINGWTRKGQNIRVRKKFKGGGISTPIVPKLIPTYIKLVHQDPLVVYAGETEQYAMVETDAMDEWNDAISFEIVKCTNKKIKVLCRKSLKNGRMRLYIDASTADLYDVGTIVARLDLGDGNEYTDEFSFSVKERPTKAGGGKADKKSNKELKASYSIPKVVCHVVGFTSSQTAQDRLLSGSPVKDLYEIGAVSAFDDAEVDEEKGTVGRIDIWISGENRSMAQCTARVGTKYKLFTELLKEQLGVLAINAIQKQREKGVEEITDLGIDWLTAVEQASLTIASSMVKY